MKREVVEREVVEREVVESQYYTTQHDTAPHSTTQRHIYGVSPPLLLTWFVRTRLHMGLVRVAVSSALGGGRRGTEGSREER